MHLWLKCWRLIKQNRKAEAEKQRLGFEKANQIAWLQKQEALNAVQRESGYNFKMQKLETGERMRCQFENERIQKQKEFDSIFERANLERETTIQMFQIESTRPVAETPTVVQSSDAGNWYIPKLPIHHESESLQCS